MVQAIYSDHFSLMLINFHLYLRLIETWDTRVLFIAKAAHWTNSHMLKLTELKWILKSVAQ